MILPAELAVTVYLRVGQKSKLADGDGGEEEVEGVYTCRKIGAILFKGKMTRMRGFLSQAPEVITCLQKVWAHHSAPGDSPTPITSHTAWKFWLDSLI